MATDAPAQPQWYWQSNGPEGLFLGDTTGWGGRILEYNPPSGWQPYSNEINKWLERALSYMKQDHNDSDMGPLRIGLFLPMIKGQLDDSWEGHAIDFCNGIVMIDHNNYININEMKQYDQYDARKCKEVKREPPITNRDEYYFHTKEDIIGQMLSSIEIKRDAIELQFKMKEASRKSGNKFKTDDQRKEENRKWEEESGWGTTFAGKEADTSW